MKDMFLWSSDFWDNYDDEEEAKLDFGDLIMYNKGYSSEDEITFEELIEEFYDMNGIHYDEFRDAILHHDKVKRINDGAYLVVADLGLWDGRRAGGKIFGSLLGVINEVGNGCDDVRYEIKDNDLVITARHHDGTNYYTVRYVTPRGYDWAERNYGTGCDVDEECHEHLLKTKGYTRKMFTGNWKFEW